MSFVSQAKDKLKKEYDAYKYNKSLENDPAIVRAKLQDERARMKVETQKLREQKEFEREKTELKELQRSNSSIGKFGAGVKSYLADVKASQQVGKKQNKLRDNTTLGAGRNIIYDQKPTNNFSTFTQDPKGSKSLILSDEKSKSSVFGHSGGVLGNREQPQPKKKKQNKTIIIKL